jgi:carbamoyl-phosphate synthase large subunit
VELLRAFRRAYSVLGLEGILVGVDVDALAPGLQIVHKGYIVPSVGSDEYISILEAICRRDEIDLVLPLIDPDIPVLARARPMLEAAGARVGVVSQAAAALTADKWRTNHFFETIGLTTPKSWLPEDIRHSDVEFPLFIKPRAGSAGKDAFRVENRRELEFFLGYVPQPIVQQCIDGPEITSDVLCDLDGTLLGVVCRRRIEVRSGEVAKGVTVHHQSIIDGCARVANELPALGPITVQCLMNGESPCFTEINARCGGGVPLAIAAGLDLPLLLLSRCAGRPVPPPALGEYQTNLHIIRFDESYFLTERQREEVAACRIDTHRAPSVP